MGRRKSFTGCIENRLLDAHLEEQESSSRVRTNSRLWGQRRSRRGAGRGKYVHTEGQRPLGFPPRMYATGQEAQMRKAWAKLGTKDSWTDCATAGGDGNGWTGDAHCLTAQLPLLLPSSTLRDTVHLLCKGYSPKSRGPASKLLRTCQPLQAVKLDPATSAGRTDLCFQRGCWGASWAWGALNTSRYPMSGNQAAHSLQCKGCCCFGFINDWAESCFSKELYPNHLQFRVGSEQNLSNLQFSPLGHRAKVWIFKYQFARHL